MYHEIEARIHYKIIVNMTEDFSLKFLIFVNISKGPKFNFWSKLDQRDCLLKCLDLGHCKYVNTMKFLPREPAKCRTTLLDSILTKIQAKTDVLI